MKREQLEHWLKNIYSTQEEEISCSECFDLVAHYVDAELSGEDAGTKMYPIKQHLDQCPACHEEYETLRDLRLLEEKGELPLSGDLQDLIP